MFLCIFIHFNYYFKTLTQCFYIASSHINIRTRNKITAGVLIIRRRNNYTLGRPCKKKIEKKISQCRTVPKIVLKLSHSISFYIEPNYALS